MIERRSEIKKEFDAIKSYLAGLSTYDQWELLGGLTGREQTVILSRISLGYGLKPRTLREIGESCGLTPERIRQVEYKALRRIAFRLGRSCQI